MLKLSRYHLHLVTHIHTTNEPFSLKWILGRLGIILSVRIQQVLLPEYVRRAKKIMLLIISPQEQVQPINLHLIGLMSLRINVLARIRNEVRTKGKILYIRRIIIMMMQGFFNSWKRQKLGLYLVKFKIKPHSLRAHEKTITEK